ncbi:hypothetical protein LRS74_00490 [Streptomyces sp. LX-29]|uniref:hypothetical protein n=1 Tax=Streptomyces sp. LX-29 TaxID=2900152 RepID=UPI00240E7F01|nr:hypothetical protein [Streptomyces sp. LX-29]WFB11973.1 hypothetical protein LRS74_00490 [Streptomyces sp. LX-29]
MHVHVGTGPPMSGDMAAATAHRSGPGDLIQLVVGVALATVRVEDVAQLGRLLGLVLEAVHAGPRSAGE